MPFCWRNNSSMCPELLAHHSLLASFRQPSWTLSSGDIQQISDSSLLCRRPLRSVGLPTHGPSQAAHTLSTVLAAWPSPHPQHLNGRSWKVKGMHTETPTLYGPDPELSPDIQRVGPGRAQGQAGKTAREQTLREQMIKIDNRKGQCSFSIKISCCQYFISFILLDKDQYTDVLRRCLFMI